MTGIPFEFAPSLLLQYEQIPSVVKTMLKSSRTSRDNRKWEQAERYALDAQDACKRIGSQASLAVTQLHLADLYCQVGELGIAMGLYQKAYRIFTGQSVGVQRHNQAVAAYAQGLLHTLWPFSNDMQTLRWYQKALTLFKEAQEFWATRQDRQYYAICTNTLSYLQEQVKGIRAGVQTMPGTLDILHLDSVDTPFDRVIQGHVLDDHRVEIDKTTYRLHSGTLSSRDVDDAHYCFALPVHEQLKAVPAAQDDDYVIVRLCWWLEKEQSKELDNVWMPGVVWLPGDGWDVGGFTVTTSGRIWFYPTKDAQIVGGEDAQSAGREAKDPTGAIKGHIIGLLKPDTTPSSAEEDDGTKEDSQDPKDDPEPGKKNQKPEGGLDPSSAEEDDGTKEDGQDPKDDPEPGEEAGQIRVSPTQIQVLDPVWLFSDDLIALGSLLESSGKIGICTPEASYDECSQVSQNLPVSQLDLSVPEIEVSVTIHPRRVDVRWPHDWDPPTPKEDVVNQVQKFVASRRHPLYILGKKGWQLVTMSIAFALLLPMALFDFLSEGSNDILQAMGILGILIGSTLLALAFAGRNMPSSSHVTLWKWTREKFSRTVQRIAYFMASVGVVFSFGIFVGSRGQASEWGWLTLLGLVIAVSAVVWLFGLSLQKVEQ